MISDYPAYELSLNKTITTLPDPGLHLVPRTLHITVRSDQMEPADPAQLTHKLGQQDAILESQQQQLLAVMQCVQTMTHQMATLSTAVQAANTIPAAWPTSTPATPDLGVASPRNESCPGDPWTPPPAPREVRWIPWRMSKFSDAVSTNFQPPTPNLPLWCCKSRLYHHPTHGQG